MYSAIIASIVVRPHPNADRLQLGVCVGHQVIVGPETKTGDVGIFFPPDGQLSVEYAKVNKLMKEDGGYLDEKRRVKALRLRGEKSEGLFMPLSSLDYTLWFTTQQEDLLPGELLTDLGGHLICNRYETPQTRKQGLANKQQKMRPENMYFKKHIDTQQFRFFKDQIPDNAHIIITEKLHGTSGRYGRVLTEQVPTWWERLLGRKPKTRYEYLVGTRNTILDASRLALGTSFYGNESFRFEAVKGIELYEGEILYFELVGFTVDQVPELRGPTWAGKLIMAAQPIKDKELQKQYGKEMRYSYGQAEGTCGLYVYRITRTTAEGVVTELSWNQVKQRCTELEINYTQEFEQFVSNAGAQSAEYVVQAVESHTDGPSTLDSGHIREGVVVRVESASGTNWYKNKSFNFGVLEGYIKDADDYVDVEESS